ncbi:MAG: monomethylamine:corrinoid methyltransferase [Anaerolineae bacterium]|nr:monomethylamine:corrinoid methyltransferase [Anaerolineae bacterium]
MPSLLDFMERATTGRIVSEEAFNMKALIPNIRKIVREYDIRYDGENPVSTDDGAADRLFEAALDFVARTGVYCDATNRVIHIDRAEVLEAVQNLPEGSYFGEGRDRGFYRPRQVEDENPPWIQVGSGVVASSEEIAMAQVEGYGSIPQARSVCVPALNQVQGMPAIGGSPLEVYASIASVQAARKALWRCGRAGLPIMNLIASATTAVSTLAGSFPTFGLRLSDAWLVDFLAEMKVNFETLNRLAFLTSIGGNVGSTALPILGGYAGGPAGTALVMTAYYLLGILLFKGAYHMTGPVHFRHGCSTTRDSLWVFSIVGRATSRHTRYPDLALAYAAAGPCTRMYFYEAAAANLACVPSGYGGVQTVIPAAAIVEDGITPMEGLFNAEVAYAAAGVQAEQANEWVNRLLEQYEAGTDDAPQGKRYQECYDVKTRKPSEDYVRLHDEVKEELAGMGIPFQF